MPLDTDWARLAALIDGEGSILINERNRAVKSNWGAWLRLVVCNTDPRMILWLKRTFGGAVCIGRRRPNERCRYQLKWHVSCRKAEELLRGCYPYLVCKQDQADIAFAYQESLGGPGKRVTLETMIMRKNLRAQLKEVRAKGYTLDELSNLRDEVSVN